MMTFQEKMKIIEEKMEIIPINDEQIIHWICINFSIIADKIDKDIEHDLKHARNDKDEEMIIEAGEDIKIEYFEMDKEPIYLKVQTVKIQKVPRKPTIEEEALKWFFEELEQFGIGERYGEIDNHDYCQRNHLKDECYLHQSRLNIEQISDEIVFSEKISDYLK